MIAPSTTHATFVIERKLDYPPRLVFSAWADAKAKSRWFSGPEEWGRSAHRLDFRVGGTEQESSGPAGGPVHHFDAIYHDIVPDARIIYSYDMRLDEKRITVSLATIEFKPLGTGTRMIFTEQIVFLDGADHLPERKAGTEESFDKLEVELKRMA